MMVGWPAGKKQKRTQLGWRVAGLLCLGAGGLLISRPLAWADVIAPSAPQAAPPANQVTAGPGAALRAAMSAANANNNPANAASINGAGPSAAMPAVGASGAVAPAKKTVVGAPSVPVEPQAVGGAVPTKSPGGGMQEVLFESPGEDKGTSKTLRGASQSLPKAQSSGPKVTIIVKQMDIDQIFDRIRQQTGVRVRSEGAAKNQKLDLMARGIPLEDLLTQIATPRQWVWVKEDDTAYAVYDQQTFVNTVQAKQVLRVPFQLKYIDAEELDKIIQPILTPQIGASSPDGRTNKLIVTDLPDKIALITSIIQEYDVQLYTRVFDIKNAKADEVAEQLNNIKSKSAEIQTDPINRTIIVKDSFEKIKMMEQLVEILDRDQEIRIYNINNIGVDGEVAEDLIQTFIEPIATENAIVEFNKATGKLFVKDVRSVQDKILDILKQIDRPRKQVLVEGEILSVVLNNDLTLGSTWQASSNLNDAITAQQPGTVTSSSSSSSSSSTSSSSSDSSSSTFPTSDKGLPMASLGSGGLTLMDFSKHLRYELTALLTDSRTRLLLRPRLLIANHEQGSFNVTTNEPILQTYYNNYSSSASNTYSSSGQTTVETGIIVEITPHISNRGLVELETHFENSSPLIIDDIGNGTRGVGSNVESAETFLIIPSGETRVIGGLIRDNNEDSDSGIPYVSKVPYVGWLFGNRTRNKDQRDLMFFITPTIVEEEPQNDIVVEPVNQLAKLTMAREAKAAEEETTDTTTAVNPVPDALRPYLEQIRPDALPMPGANGSAQGASATAGHSDESTTQTAARAASTAAVPEQAGPAELKPVREMKEESAEESGSDASLDKTPAAAAQSAKPKRASLAEPDEELPTSAPATSPARNARASAAAQSSADTQPEGSEEQSIAVRFELRRRKLMEEKEAAAKGAPAQDERGASRSATTGAAKKVTFQEPGENAPQTDERNPPPETSRKLENNEKTDVEPTSKSVSAANLLRNDPYVEPRIGAAPLKIGGAVASLNQGATGPKGALGGGSSSKAATTSKSSSKTGGAKSGSSSAKATPTPSASKSKTKSKSTKDNTPSYMRSRSSSSSSNGMMQAGSSSSSSSSSTN